MPSLIELSKLVKDPEMRRVMESAQLIESSSLGLLLAISLHQEFPPRTMLSILKEILWLVHQNFLVQMQFMRSRMATATKKNVYAQAIKKIIAKHRAGGEENQVNKFSQQWRDMDSMN